MKIGFTLETLKKIKIRVEKSVRKENGSIRVKGRFIGRLNWPEAWFKLPETGTELCEKHKTITVRFSSESIQVKSQTK